jgi:hypothetical protein
MSTTITNTVKKQPVARKSSQDLTKITSRMSVNTSNYNINQKNLTHRRMFSKPLDDLNYKAFEMDLVESDCNSSYFNM